MEACNAEPSTVPSTCCFNQESPLHDTSKQACSSKTSEYIHGPGNLRNLQFLATGALSQHFPGLDPLDVALLVADSQRKSLKLKCISLPTLSDLCKLFLSEKFPMTDIESIIANRHDTEKKEHKIGCEVDIESYLKKLTHKKVTITVTRLDREVIELWTKTHWSQLDPYSDLDNETISELDADKSESEAQSSEAHSIEVHQHSNLGQPVSMGGHILRSRKRHYTMNRPHRESAHKFY